MKSTLSLNFGLPCARVLAAFAIFLSASSSAQANERGYATDLAGTLWVVDFTTLSATSIGSTGIVFQAIAQRSDGILFGTSSQGRLYTINTANAAATLIGNTNLGDVESLDFNGNVLVGIDFQSNSRIYSIDQSNATATLLATPNQSTGTIRAGVVLDSDTILVRGDFPAPSLYSVKFSSGATTQINISNTFLNLAGMDFIDGTLYGVGQFGNLYRINSATGTPTIIGNAGSQFFLGLTAIVPEPATPFLVSAAAPLILTLRRRKTAAENRANERLSLPPHRTSDNAI